MPGGGAEPIRQWTLFLTRTADKCQRKLDKPLRIAIRDALLRLCQEHGLQLNWRDGQCRVRSSAGGSEEVVETPLRTSVFRAILARLAALCNEREANAVSPYGGQCELSIGTDPVTFLRVSFANTPDEQWLELTPVAETQE